MFFRYIKLAVRKIVLRPLYPAIAVFGLTIGFTAVILVALWTKDEISYDNFHEKADNVYRITVEINNDETGWHWDFARSFYGWLRHMPEDFPEVESMVRLVRWRRGIVKVGEKTWNEEIFNADDSLPSVFTLHFLSGDRKTCLSNPRQVILSESHARKYFGEEDPLDKTIFLYSSYTTEKTPFTVSGIFRDFPSNAHVHLNVVASIENPDQDLGWAYNYITLAKNSKPSDVLASFNDFASKYADTNTLALLTPHLQNIKDIHLKSNKDRELEKNGSLIQVKIIMLLAIFVLFITLFNFFNIRFVFLLKDRKTLSIIRFSGARPGGIFNYLLSESLIYAILASILSLIAVTLIYPYFNILMNKTETAGYSEFRIISLITVFSLLLITTLTGILPYVIAKGSGYIKSLSGMESKSFLVQKSSNKPGILKTLIAFQFFASFILIVAVFVINNQVGFFMESSLGGKSEKLLCIKNVPVQSVNQYQVFKQELLENSLIKNVTASMENPGDDIRDMMGFQTTGVSDDKANQLLYISPVDDNFFEFYGIPVIAGNNFPEFNGIDSLPESYILNETAVKLLGWDAEAVIGKPFKVMQQYMSGKMGKIVGVVKDFQPSSMSQEIKPYVYFQKSFWFFSSQIRYDTSRTAESFAYIQQTWKDIYPDFPMDYEYVDSLYKEIYKGEIQLRNMSILLCILALLLSASGLFGITGIAYESRTKEIGIRKVNGASISKVVFLLLQDILFIITVVISGAIPISYFLANKWLENYVNHITPSVWLYLLSGIGLITMAILTVCSITWQAARKNPVEALRYE